MKHPLRAAAVTLVFGIAFAADSPLTKDGLWSVHSVSTISPGGKTMDRTASMCRSRAYDAQQAEEAKGKGTCKPPVSKTEGWTTTVTESECTIGAVTMKIKETVSVIDENTVHSTTESSNSPAIGAARGINLTADMKYLGPCPAGMKPGDVMGPDGKIMSRPGR
jgi:hypothetical protein